MELMSHHSLFPSKNICFTALGNPKAFMMSVHSVITQTPPWIPQGKTFLLPSHDYLDSPVQCCLSRMNRCWSFARPGTTFSATALKGQTPPPGQLSAVLVVQDRKHNEGDCLQLKHPEATRQIDLIPTYHSTYEHLIHSCCSPQDLSTCLQLYVCLKYFSEFSPWHNYR